MIPPPTTAPPVVETPRVPESKPSEPKHSNRKSNPLKRKRFTGPNSNPGFNKKPTASGLVLRPTRKIYLLHTDLSATNYITEIVHRCIIRRDQRLGTQISEPLLRYVTTITLVYRLANVSVTNAYSYELEELINLKVMAEAAILPETIARYIECIGTVNHEGVTYAPHVQSADTYRKMITDALADIPEEFRSGAELKDTRAFMEYMECTSRSYKSGVKMRKIKEACEGTPEFLAAYRGSKDEATAYYPVSVLEPAAQLGAAYRLRDLSTVETWLGHRDSITYNFSSYVYDQCMLLSQCTIDTLSARS